MVVLICCSEASRPRPDTSTRASLLTAAEQRAASEGTLRTGPPSGGGWAGADLVLAAKLQALREEALRQLQCELQQREEANRRAALHLGAAERDARRKVRAPTWPGCFLSACSAAASPRPGLCCRSCTLGWLKPRGCRRPHAQVLEQSGGAAGRGGSAQQQQPAGRVDAASTVMQLLGQRSNRVTPAAL